MIDLETIMKRIEALGVEEKTTKELKEYGLNDYYIKKATQEGRLEKIDRGKYRLTNIADAKIKKAYHYFNQFKKISLREILRQHMILYTIIY